MVTDSRIPSYDAYQKRPGGGSLFAIFIRLYFSQSQVLILKVSGANLYTRIMETMK